MPYCAVANCKSHSGIDNEANAVSYYNFPTNIEIQQKWIDATGRPDWSPLENSVICSKHFDNKCFISGPKSEKSELFCDAIPTKHLPNDEIIIDSDNSEELEESEDELFKCTSSKGYGSYSSVFEKAKEINGKQRLMIKRLRQQNRRNMKKIKLQNRVLNDLMEIYNLKHGDIAILRTEIMKSEEFKKSCLSI